MTGGHGWTGWSETNAEQHHHVTWLRRDGRMREAEVRSWRADDVIRGCARAVGARAVRSQNDACDVSRIEEAECRSGWGKGDRSGPASDGICDCDVHGADCIIVRRLQVDLRGTDEVNVGRPPID